MGQREILAGSVLDLHQQGAESAIPEGDSLAATADHLIATALRVKDERDEALKLLRRTLELREMGNEGSHKSDIRAFLARIGEPVAIPRFARQQSIERSIVAFNPEPREAIELVHSLQRALQDRFDAKASDVDDLLGQACQALEELERTL